MRDATREAGFTFTQDDPGSYFGFPIVSLETVLRTRKVPFRPNYRSIVDLERSRPGFFELADLDRNRPAPNYVLHESAHAVAFKALFGRPRDVRAALADRDHLARVMLGESFAMGAEYLAACSVTGRLHGWLFSINSYRHRVQGKKAVGELIDELGSPIVAWAILGAFLHTNFLIGGMTTRRLERLLDASTVSRGTRLPAPSKKKLRRALVSLMPMNPEFCENTSRIFLASLGYPRAIRRVLDVDPLDLIERDDRANRGIRRLVEVLAGTPAPAADLRGPASRRRPGAARTSR